MYQSNQKNVLSAREKQCAQLILNGMTAKEIGQQLGLSSRTIESYIENMKIKLMCRNKIELIIALTKRGTLMEHPL